MDGVFKKSERRWKGKHTAGENVAFEMYTDSSTGRGLEHKVLRGHGIGKIK